MIREAVAKLVEGRDLSSGETGAVMEELMEGTATPAQTGAFLAALRLKGETTGEIAGLAGVMRRKSRRVKTDLDPVDTCGTGGDGARTFNVSTTAAFVVAGAGQPVAKHGNRAMSSSCGSADVLEALGVHIGLGPEETAVCLAETGIAFMFAQVFHPAMRILAPVRRELGVPTVFNVLGPLTNPAGAPYQVVGVARPELMRRMAEALGLLGSRRALVVHGMGGLDELSLEGTSMICEWTGHEVVSYTVHPAELGLQTAPVAAVRGGTAAENAAILRSVLAGERGPRRDLVLLNAGAALYACGRGCSLAEGVGLAAESIDCGAARSRLKALVRTSRLLAGLGPPAGAAVEKADAP